MNARAGCDHQICRRDGDASDTSATGELVRGTPYLLAHRQVRKDG